MLRADFPGGSTDELWNSIQQKTPSLPDDTRLFIGHDYGADGRDTPRWEATVAFHRAVQNVHVKDGTDKADYIKTRADRDATLGLPDRMRRRCRSTCAQDGFPMPKTTARTI